MPSKTCLVSRIGCFLRYAWPSQNSIRAIPAMSGKLHVSRLPGIFKLPSLHQNTKRCPNVL